VVKLFIIYYVSCFAWLMIPSSLLPLPLTSQPLDEIK